MLRRRNRGEVVNYVSCRSASVRNLRHLFMTTVFVPNLHWWNSKTNRWVKWKSKSLKLGTIFRYGYEQDGYCYGTLATHNWLFWKRDLEDRWIKAE